MTTSVFNEKRHPGQFILNLAEGNRSLDNVTLLSGQVVEVGQVLGKITSGGKFTAYDNGASDGSQAAAAISLNYVDATAGDTLIAVVVRAAEVKADELVFLSGTSDNDKTAAYADLKALGVIARTETGV